MKIVSRKEWGARYADGAGPAPLPSRGLYLHHTVTLAPDLDWLDADADGVDDDEQKAMRQLEQIGQQRFRRGISYTWCLPPSGRLYQGHSVGRLGAHTGGMNSRVRAVALIGDYSSRRPTDAQEATIAELLRLGVAERWWPRPVLLGGHRDVAGTACPGQAAYDRIPAINARASAEPMTDPQEESVLTIGAAGPAVAFLQECLRAEALAQDPPRPWGKDVSVDGQFGEHTQQAVDRFQRGAGLSATGAIDGVTAAVLTHFAPAWA